MAITVTQGPTSGAYGSLMADSARQEEYMKQLNPFLTQYFGEQFQSGETQKQMAWKSGESALDRTQQTKESALDRALRESMQNSQQQWQTGERTGSQAFQTTESAAERALRERLQQMQLNNQLQQQYLSSYRPIVNTVGTPMGVTGQKYQKLMGG
jgi:hypothetical protein